MKLLIIFIVFNALNVIIQTVKSIATIKCGKWISATVNAIAYGLYTYIVVLTVCDLPLWQKMVIVAGCNFIGVFVVKLFEEKMRKDRLWKIECTFNYKENFLRNLKVWAEVNKVPYNYVNLNKYYAVNFYCATKQESQKVKEFIEKFNGKYFVSESKNL